jgi:hypothetical protein
MIPEKRTPTPLQVAQRNLRTADAMWREARAVVDLAEARRRVAEMELDLLAARNRVEALERGVS